jgi:serine protease AprX
VAGADGAADVSNVLAAIQWAVSFRERYGIRILNLSLGTDSTQSWDVDPFNYAVERAWDEGLVVVVSASNRGPRAGTISKPGDDPWVITVGAVDDRGTRGRGDDRLPDFSSRGPTAAGIAKPDVAAPGAHVVSLRAPGSTIDPLFPALDGAHRRGSGTSMATAVVSGGVALLLEQHPEWSPAAVKAALRDTAQPSASRDANAVGRGVVALADASRAAPHATAIGRLRHSSGRGSLDASRGTVQVVTRGPMGTVLDGFCTAQLVLWDPIAFTTGSWRPSTWPLSAWALHNWYRVEWYGDDWSGGPWQGNNWHGNNWHGDWEGSTGMDGGGDPTDHYGDPWSGAAWFGLWE